MKTIATLAVLALACSFAQAAERELKPQQQRMITCQKEATASGKKGQERRDVLRTCLADAKKKAPHDTKHG